MNNGSLLEMKVPVQVVLGEAELPVEGMTRMVEGTIVELESLAGEPVELRATGKKIAEGEVVVIDEHFGIRITSIISDGDDK